MSSGVPSSYTLGQYKIPTFIAIVSAHAATCNILGGKTDTPAFIFIFVKTCKKIHFVIVVHTCDSCSQVLLIIILNLN